MLSKFLSIAALTALATAQGAPNLTAALMSTPDLSQLASVIGLAPPELLNTLSTARNVTILAPSNAAFAKLNSSGRAAALTDRNALTAILSYHVLNGTYPSSAVTNKSAFIPTLLNNNPAYANVTGGQRVEVIKQGNNVVFYSGLLQNSTVTKADTNFTGGVIHIIDNLLTPPVNVSSTAVAAGLSGTVGALTKANLVSTIDNTPDLTVFAPNNEAFKKIGSALGNLSMSALTNILDYHVVKGTVGYSSLLMDGMKLPTLVNGANLTVKLSGNNVFVNGAKVVTPNVLVANGVVHVIDNVLNPNATSASPSASATTGAPAFAGASSISDLPLTSGVPTATSPIGAGAAGATSAAAASSSRAASSTSNPASPMRTGAMGAAALFAGAGVAFNL